MSTALIDLSVAVVLYMLGITVTIMKFGKRNRAAFTAVAIVSPIIAMLSVFRVLYLFLRGNLKVDPCPAGLEEAENLVEIHRQQMFGGKLRTPTFATSWKVAYDRELQVETERAQKIAERYLVVA